MNIDDPSLSKQFWELPTLAAIKDANSNYIAATKAAAEFLFGKTKPHAVIGLRDEDIPGEASTFSEVFKAQDKIIMTKGQNKSILDINIWASGTMRIMLTTKQRYVDINGQFGVYFSSLELTGDHLLKVAKLLCQDKKFISSQGCSYEIVESFNERQLTSKETECLYYLIRGYTAKMIARVLLISYRTVENHIEQLKIKFKCNTKAELIDKAISSGCLYLLVKSFISKPISIIL